VAPAFQAADVIAATPLIGFKAMGRASLQRLQDSTLAFAKFCEQGIIDLGGINGRCMFCRMRIPYSS
jgi:hypothetical protein